MMASACDNAVSQYADSLDFEFDDIARREPTSQFHPAAGSDRPRSQQFAGMKRFPLRNEGDQVGKAIGHRRGTAAAPALAIDPRLHLGIRHVEGIVDRKSTRLNSSH